VGAWLFRPFGGTCPFGFHHASRFREPPYDPGRSDFPSPVLTLACPPTAFPWLRRLKRWPVSTPLSHGLHCGTRPLFNGSATPALRPGRARARQVSRGALPGQGVTSPRVMSGTTSEGVTPPSSLIPPHASDQNSPAASSLGLGRRVFAGCCQPLLRVGPSRRYLCGSFPGCLDPYPGSPHGARARSFPWGYGLPCVRTRSALSFVPHGDFSAGSYFEAAVIH